MGRKKMPGLYKRGNIWHIDKAVYNQRIRESTGTDSLDEAERFLVNQIEKIRKTLVYGERPKRIFREAAVKFLKENQSKASIKDDAGRLKVLDKFIGDMPLDLIHMGTLQTFIEARKDAGVKMRTINHGLKVVRRILNLAASEWIDEQGLTWLLAAPKIKLLPEHDLRKPYPLTWEEQNRLFNHLPSHLKHMAEFAVNTGCRDKEICSLRWEWEIKIPELAGQSLFVIPGAIVKNREDRLVILNKIAMQVIEAVRGQHPVYVFSYQKKPITRILNTAWKSARIKANLAGVRVHDLKHTFGRRLRAAGVSFEDRQDLLGHKSSRITTHYSAAELHNLIEAANKVCPSNDTKPTLTLLRGASPHKFPTVGKMEIGKSAVSA